MDIFCTHCQARFVLSDEKVPKGKSFSLTCPKCKEKITVPAVAAESAPVAFEAAEAASDRPIDSWSYDASDRPFDFVEEGALTALVLNADPVHREKIIATLETMNYRVARPSMAREAIKQMRFHNFDVIVVDEHFDCPSPDQNHVLRYLERLTTPIRRDIFVALISDRFRTNDNMAAFNRSVNLVINADLIDEFDKVLRYGLAEFNAFYRVFKESLIKTGRA